MAAGRIHNQALCLIAPVAALSLGASTFDIDAAALVGLGVMSGIWLTPDLDIDDPVSSHWIVGVWFGRGPRALWRILWWPYGKAIPHRSYVSHTPVISTLFRLLYLHIALQLLTVGRFHFLSTNIYLWWWIIGLILADFTHWALDVFRPLRFLNPRPAFRPNRRFQ